MSTKLNEQADKINNLLTPVVKQDTDTSTDTSTDTTDTSNTFQTIESFTTGLFVGIIEVFPYDSYAYNCRGNFTLGYEAGVRMYTDL